MELLIQILIAGMAVGYVTEFISGILDRLIPSTITKRVTTLPISALFLWILGIEGLALAVAIPAAGFFALVILSIVNRPVVINSSGRRV